MFRRYVTLPAYKSFSSHKTKRPTTKSKSARDLPKAYIPRRTGSVPLRAQTITFPLIILQRPLGVCNPNEKQKPSLLAELGA